MPISYARFGNYSRSADPKHAFNWWNLREIDPKRVERIIPYHSNATEVVYRVSREVEPRSNAASPLQDSQEENAEFYVRPLL